MKLSTRWQTSSAGPLFVPVSFGSKAVEAFQARGLVYRDMGDYQIRPQK